jgi:type I restriction enzyme S subunit
VIETWKDTNLGEVFESITNGVNCDQKSNSGAHLITRIETISKGAVDLERIGRADLNEKELSKYRLAENDILFSHINSPIHVGKTALFDTKAEVYHGVNLLRIRTIKDVNPKFLRYFLLFLYTSGFWRTVAKQSVNQASVNQKDISEVPFSYPSLEKQGEIVKKLDSAFTKIDLLEANLSVLENHCEELLYSIQRDLFSSNFKVVRIGDICKLMTGGTPSRSRPEYFLNGNIKWLVSGDIHQGEIYDCEGRITLEAMKSSNTKILPLNSVMIALNGQGKTRASVALLRTEATCNQSLVSISPINEKELLSEFLFHNLKMRYQELRRMTGDDGNDRRGLNMILIRDIEIPLPSLEKQHEIVDKLVLAFIEIESLKRRINTEMEFSSSLRKSLLSNSFTQKEVFA